MIMKYLCDSTVLAYFKIMGGKTKNWNFYHYLVFALSWNGL